MKKLITLLAALVPLCNLIAQTYLHQEFGASKAQVQNFLKTKKTLTISTLDDHTLRVTTAAFSITYYFAADQLYKIETLSEYENRKIADDAVAALEDQYARQSSVILEIAHDKALTRVASRNGSELNEVSAYSPARGSAVVMVKSMDLNRTPNRELAELQQADHPLFAIAHR